MLRSYLLYLLFMVCALGFALYCAYRAGKRINPYESPWNLALLVDLMVFVIVTFLFVLNAEP